MNSDEMNALAMGGTAASEHARNRIAWSVV